MYFRFTLVMAYLEFLFFFDLPMVLIHREVINSFTDTPKKDFGSEDIIFILSRLPNFT